MAGQNLLAQQSLVEKYLKKDRARLSVFSFVSVFTWQEHFEFRFELIDDCLCVFACNPVGMFLYWPPLGNTIKPKTINRCFDVMEKINRGNGVSRIENVGFEQLAVFPENKFAHYKKSYEYVYYRKDLVGLQGNALKSKRSSYNQFIKSHPAEFRPFSKAMRRECLKLYEQWVTQRRASTSDEVYQQMLEDNRSVHALAMEYYEELGLVGRVVLIDGKIKAYSFGYPLGSADKRIF